MMVYDLIMIVVLGAATVWGIYKGLAWQLASLSSIFLSYVVAYQFRGLVATHINAEPPWNIALSMLILYLGTSLVVWIAFRLVKGTIDRIRLQEFDHHVGGVVGFAKGVILCVIVTLFAMTLFSDRERNYIVNSHSGYYIAVLLDKSHAVLPPEVYDRIHPLMHALDESLPDDYEGFHDHEHNHAPAAPNDQFRYGQANGGTPTYPAQPTYPANPTYPTAGNPTPNPPQGNGVFRFR